MNLEKLLAANMIRFGVKNLNEELRKTLLNEGFAPGDTVTTYTGTKAVEVGTPFTTIALNKVQPYPKGFVQGGAILAMAVGILNLIKKDKKLQKTYPGVTISDIYGAIAGGVVVTTPEALVASAETAGNFTYLKTEVSIYPSPTNPGAVATMGGLGTNAGYHTATNTEKQKSSLYGHMIEYLNDFNFQNVLGGDFTQYRLSNMVDEAKFINLLKTEVATNTVIVYTKTTKAADTAGKDINTTQQGATEPIDKVYDVNFAQSVATVPPNDSEVARAIADAIAMFPDGNISNLSVVSSASPEYGTIKNVPGWEKSYTKGITGTGNPGDGTDDASKNIKLAYDRGVNFVAAINAGLAAQGKPEMVNTSINWQISATGGSPNSLGRFSNVNWSKAGTPGKPVTTLDNTGKEGDTISGKDTFTVFQHVFTCVS